MLGLILGNGRSIRKQLKFLINNIGIIGLGSIGCRHLRLVREIRPELNIIAVRSGQGEKVQEEKLAYTVLYSLDEVIDAGVKAAVVATPATAHIQQAIDLMEKGIHILIEKPLSHSLDNVNELLRVEKESKRVGLVGYCLHYNTGALKFNDMLKNKKIGQILHVRVDCGSYLPEWRKGQDYRESVSAKAELGGGVLLELSHELDYIRWFFGEMKNVSANIQNSGTLGIDVEDSVDMIFESEQGFPVSVHLDFNSRSTRRKCITRCSNGDLIWDIVANKVIWHPADGSEEVETYQNDRDYIYKEQLNHFFDCIENKKRPLVSIDNGVAVLRMVESAKESHQTGKRIVLT
jgi:predicted dehydrogenase